MKKVLGKNSCRLTKFKSEIPKLLVHLSFKKQISNCKQQKLSRKFNMSLVIKNKVRFRIYKEKSG